MQISWSLVLITGMVVAQTACSEAKPKREPEVMVYPSGFGGCRDKESGYCIERADFAASAASCANKEREEHLPGGCPKEARLGKCSLYGGNYLLYVYQAQNVQRARTLCDERGGEWGKG